jgi:hypothetical protein
VFPIEICRECGGAVKVIAYVEDPVMIRKILDHLKEKGEYQDPFRLSETAARHKRAWLTKENPFVNHQEVAGDTRHGSRSAVGSDGAGHRPKSGPCLGLRHRTR